MKKKISCWPLRVYIACYDPHSRYMCVCVYASAQLVIIFSSSPSCPPPHHCLPSNYGVTDSKLNHCFYLILKGKKKRMRRREKERLLHWHNKSQGGIKSHTGTDWRCRVPILFSGISHDGGGDDGDELYDMYRKRNLPPSVDLGLCCAMMCGTMLCGREKNTHTHTVKRYYMTSLKQKG